jgi:hypothetical protein
MLRAQGELRLEPKAGEQWEVHDDAGGRWHLERAALR